jgi:hypothetical protein
MSDTGYQIILSDGSVLGGSTYEITDISLNPTSNTDVAVSSLALPRRGSTLYSTDVVGDMVRLMENFASDGVAPHAPIAGQLWYNKSASALQIWNGSSFTSVSSSLATGLATPVTINIVDATGGPTNTQVIGTGSFDGATTSNLQLTALPATGVVPGTYSAPTITIGADGRILAVVPAAGLGAGGVVAALGYTPADDTKVVHKTGDTMTGSLVINNANLNVTGSGHVMQGGNILIPAGFIGMWSGSSTAVPAGWVLCDGSNGTPRLTGNFIVATGGSYGDGSSGGANFVTVTTSAAGASSPTGTTDTQGAHSHGGATSATALSVDQLPSHSHTLGGGNGAPTIGHGYGYTGSTGVSGAAITSTDPTGSGNGHTHPISTDGAHAHTVTVSAIPNHTHTVSFDNRPTYYALAYIMKT